MASLALVFSAFGLNTVSAAEKNKNKHIEYIEVDQELVNKAIEVEQEIDQYISVTKDGFLQLHPKVKGKYGKELYNFFLYGVYMNNERIAKGELLATENGIISTEIPETSGGITTFSNGCTWSNFGKSLIGGALTGAVTGAIGGAAIGGVGAGPGAGVGAIGGFAAGGVEYFATCWW